MKRQDLLHALETVRPGLADKEIIEQSSSFAFVNQRVVAFNNALCITHPVDLALECAVKSGELYKSLNKIKTDDVDITVDHNELVVRAGKIKIGITVQSEIKLPLQEVKKPKKWFPLQDDFIPLVNIAMYSCARDLGDPILNCVHLNKNIIEASDSYRITVCTLTKSLPIAETLLPLHSVQTVLKIKPNKIADSDGWVHFGNDEDTVVSCRTYLGDYSSLSKLLNITGTKITFPNSIEDMIDRAMIFAKRELTLAESITVTLASKRFKLTAKSESGWFEEEVNNAYNDTPLMFSVAPYLLKGVLSNHTACTVAKDRLRFDGTGWTHVVALKNMA